MGVMDDMCITFIEGDVVALPLALFHRPLISGMTISERPQFCFQGISFLGPACFSIKVGATEYGLNFMWRLRFRCLVLRSGSSYVNIILKVSAVNEFSISSFSMIHSSVV